MPQTPYVKLTQDRLCNFSQLSSVDVPPQMLEFSPNILVRGYEWAVPDIPSLVIMVNLSYISVIVRKGKMNVPCNLVNQ